MKQKTIIALFAMLLVAGSLLQAATISGFVSGKDNGEPLQYVNIRIMETNAGYLINKNGYYVINVTNPGTYTLAACLLSLGKFSKSFAVKSVAENLALDILLQKVSIEMNKVIVTAKQNDDVINTPPLCSASGRTM